MITNKRIIIFGSINMDCVASVYNHPRPGETVSGLDMQYFPGGKGANQAVAAARLGVETILFGCIGGDDFAQILTDFLKRQNVDVSKIIKTDGSTGTAFIAVDDKGENTIIIISGANAHLKYNDLKSFSFTEGDVLVCQNEVSPAEMVSVFDKAKKEKAVIIYNPAPAKDVDERLFDKADYIIVNETEAQFYDPLINTSECILIQTKGSQGVVALENNKKYSIHAESVEVIDATGAGDCFTGAFAAALTKDFSLEDALIFANRAASLSVQKKGAGVSMPFIKDLEAA